MSSHPSFDRESFQSLLANAFSVQQSGMDRRSLSAFVEIQRAITSGHADLDRNLHLIAERALDVAHATGVGIALLQGHQLVHRAGSGTASENVGRHLAAVFSAPERNDPRPEILRVENAQNDSRIEAEICRQFDALALLMMPIYREHVMIGVMEILFAEAHTFQPREVRTYQLLTTLVADATQRVQAPATAVVTPVSTVAHALWRMTSQVPPIEATEESVPTFALQDPEPWFATVCSSVAASLHDFADRWNSLQVSATITHALQRISRHKLQWNVVAIPLFVALAIAAALVNPHSSRPSGAGSASRNLTPDTAPLTPPPAQQLDASSLLKPVAAETTSLTSKPKSAFRRVRMGEDEVDEISEDVTIRHFRSGPVPRQTRSLTKQVNLGEDVTVRYFTPDGKLRPRPVSAPN
jgi:hypothetical protein